MFYYKTDTVNAKLFFDRFLWLLLLGFFLIKQPSSQEKNSSASPHNFEMNFQENNSLSSNNSFPDSITKKRYNEHFRWRFRRIDPFINSAIENGLSANQDEILKRTRMYNLIFPGIPADEYSFRNEIIVQKYLETYYYRSYSQDELHSVYNEFIKTFSLENRPSIESISDYLKLRILLEKPPVKELIKKNETERARTTQNKINQALEAWQISDLKIDLPAEICLAKHFNSDTCLLTVGDFNKKICYENVLKVHTLDSARIFAIKDILTDLFVIEQAKSVGFANSDSANVQIKNFINSISEKKKFYRLGPPVRDERALWRAYNDFYDPLFMRKKTSFYSLIGSSDSFYIDSLSMCIYSKDSNNNITGQANRNSLLLPWQSILYGDFPDSLKSIAATLKKNQISNVVKTGFGFFMLRNDSTLIHPEVDFYTVQKQLIYLATKQKWLNLDSVYNCQSNNYYINNSIKFVSPDTFYLTLKFYPAILTKDSNFACMINKTKSIIVKSSSILPTVLQSQLTELCANVKSVKGKQAIIQNSLGVWDVTIHSRKTGGVKTPYKMVKKKILDSLVLLEMDSVFNNKIEVDSSLLSVALARVFLPQHLGMSKALENTIIKDMERKRLLKDDPSFNLKVKMEVEKYREEQMNVINNWLSRINIDYNLLRENKNSIQNTPTLPY